MTKRADKPVYFAKEDKLEFLNIISKYKTFFETNDLSLFNIKRKKDFWLLIEKEYNDIIPKTGPRTADQLHSLYKNLKRKARNDAIRELETKSTKNQCENLDENDEHNFDDEETNYAFMKPTIRSSKCISEVAESSTSSSLKEEFILEPVITLESLHSSVTTNYCEPTFKTEDEPVSSTKRASNEHYNLKLKILKTELEAKKKEANINYEICLLRKEVEWKNKENAVLAKRAKLEEMQETKVLLKLKQENEILRNKLLQIEFEKAAQSLNDSNFEQIEKSTDNVLQTDDENEGE